MVAIIRKMEINNHQFQMFSQNCPRPLEVQWKVEDLLVRRAQEELQAMQNHLTEIVIVKISRVDLKLQMMKDIAQMRSQLNQVLPTIVHTQEQLDWSIFLDRIQQTLIPLRISPSNWIHMDPEEFLNQEREELECVSRMWRDATTLEVELSPMVETPALVRSPSDLLKFEMLFTTRLDPEVFYQRQFKTKLTPLMELNKAGDSKKDGDETSQRSF